MWLLYQLIGFYVSCGFALSPIEILSFAANGDSKATPGNANLECNDVSGFVADVPGIALAVDEYQSSTTPGCFPDGRYNDLNFVIQPGVVKTFRAYRITGPANPATEFLASKTTIWLTFDSAGDYKIYRVTADGVVPAGAISATAANKWYKTTLLASDQPTFLVAPAAARVSGWPLLATGAEGATLFEDTNFVTTAYRW